MEETLFTIPMASRALGITQKSLRYYILQGVIPVVKLGRKVRLRPSDIEKIQREGFPSKKEE